MQSENLMSVLSSNKSQAMAQAHFKNGHRICLCLHGSSFSLISPNIILQEEM